MTRTLYVVGTPIGNLEDISPRALRILAEVTLIAAENPLRTQRLLARYEIHTPMTRFTDAYDRKKGQRLHSVLRTLERGDVALVSEAGMPLLADPGYELLEAVREQGYPVVAIPGPTALTAALSVSGLPPVPFVFLGFLPRKSAARKKLFAEFITNSSTLVAYESPARLVDALCDAQVVFGKRRVAVACELTKLYEEVWRGTLDQAVAHFQANPPRGEFVVVIGGAEGQEDVHVG